MENIREYLMGPVLLSTIAGAAVCILAFRGSDKSQSFFIPFCILVAGLITIGAGVWGGIKQVGDKNNVRQAIGPKIRHIISFSHDQFGTMTIAARELELQGNHNPSEEKIQLVFSKLNPRESSTMGSVQERRMLNWLEFMDQYNSRTLLLIAYVYQFMPFLDSELIRLLGDIEDCYHFKEIQLQAHGPGAANKDMRFVAGAFHQYQEKIKGLSRYFENNLKQYGGSSPAMAVQPLIR